jgi:PAS domain S-box-containing protein
MASSFEMGWRQASDAVAVADREGKIRYANPAYRALYGFEEEETKEMYLDTLYQEKSAFRSLAKYRALFHREEEHHLLESKVLWADGCERITETALHFMYHLGSRVGMVAVVRDITGKRIFQERKQMENALVESERKFRAVFNQTFQYTGLLKPNGTLLEANQRLLDFAGITQTDVANKAFWEAPWWNPSPKNQLRLRSMVSEAAKGKRMRSEFEMLGLGRTPINVDFSLSPAKDETGKVVWLIAEARNVTDRKRMEVQLRVSEEKYKTLFQVLSVGIILTDETGHIVDVNPASEQIVGLSRERLMGQSISDENLKASDEREHNLRLLLRPAYQSLLENKVVKSEEVGLIRADKSVRWLHIVTTPIPLRGYGVAVAFTDVTQGRENKEAIMDSEARYRLLFDNTRFAILRTTPAFDVLEANAEACRLFGYSATAFISITVGQLNDLEDGRLRRALNETNQAGTFRGEVSLLKADGSKFLAELHIKTLHYESGTRELCVTIRSVK